MPGPFSLDHKPAKVLIQGVNGSGKTSLKAALICAGYEIRSIDADKGCGGLINLITNPHYPYAAYIKKHNIDLNKSLNYQPIDIDMDFRQVEKKNGEGKVISSETILAPTNANAWPKIIRLLREWKNDEDGINYGPITDWGPKCVLDFDTFTPIGQMCLYAMQLVNNRLGAREIGNDWQRDVGEAQKMIGRLLYKLSNDSVKCNVICNTHIRNIDDSGGFMQTPEEKRRLNPNASLDIRGLPQVIGAALSKDIGGFFNNVFTIKQQGSGRNVTRTIYTVPTEVSGALVATKSVTWLQSEYDSSTGLAEIFSEIRNDPLPEDFLPSLGRKKT